MKTGALKVEPGAKLKLHKLATDNTHGVTQRHAEQALPNHIKRLAEQHDVLYAEHKRAILIILQGMDASGKDGTIKHVMSGVNPQGMHVHAFKAPTPQELRHDFLWRVRRQVPG